MSITRADVVRILLGGPHVVGSVERIARYVAERGGLEDRLRQEFGMGGYAYNGERADWRSNGITINRGGEELRLPWKACAILLLYPVPDQACTPAECPDCVSWGATAGGGGKVQCRKTRVSHCWGQACSMKEQPLTLFDLDDFAERDDDEDDE